MVINELHTFWRALLSFPHQQDYVSVMVRIITRRDLWKYWNKDEGDKCGALQLYGWSSSILFSNSFHVYWLLFRNYTCTECQDRKHLKFELLSRKRESTINLHYREMIMIDNKQLVSFLTFLWYVVEICVLSHIIWSSLIIMFFE
jgi:hypothetical protein